MLKNSLIAFLLVGQCFPLLSREVDVTVQLQVGDKAGQAELRISSERYTQLSLDDENLGFEIKLCDEKKDDERFETNPTYNKKRIMSGFVTGKTVQFGPGVNLNGHKFEKELVLKILSVKKIS